MKISALTFIILQINSLIDSGKYSDVSISDIHDAIEGSGVLKFLKARAGSDIDLSIHLGSNTYGNFEQFFEEQMKSIYAGYAGQESRKWGVENSGLCLVLAWTNEIIQQGESIGLSYKNS